MKQLNKKYYFHIHFRKLEYTLFSHKSGIQNLNLICLMDKTSEGMKTRKIKIALLQLKM